MTMEGARPGMAVSEIQAKTLTRRQKRPDSWFVASIGMNLYRGCRHDCVYCDGRAERYYVAGEFGRDVAVKVNAPQLLRRELDPARRRKRLPGGYLLLGGGVGDSYQPLEERYALSRQALEILAEYRQPVEVLTKSTLVLRDLDLLVRIHRQRRALVCFSLSSTDEAASRTFEPGVPSPRARLEAMAAVHAAGVPCGLFLMPIIPGITDSARLLERTLQQAKAAGARFVVFGGMTLREGRQKEHFLSVLGDCRPDLVEAYRRLYPPDPLPNASAGPPSSSSAGPSGQPHGPYAGELNRRCGVLARRVGLPPRIPPALWTDLLDRRERVALILEHLDYLLRLPAPGSGQTVYGRAARVWWSTDPAGTAPGEEPPPGVAPEAFDVIREIRASGGCALYDRLLGTGP